MLNTDKTTTPTSLLRFATAGSVDDGKSTVVGRLLFDSKSVMSDQLAAVEAATRSENVGPDLALLTDGLRAEREQGITIDVAYRYFATAQRRFILADTPGHVEYTRNMVTGASTADLVLVLVDARHGVLEQTNRHLAIAALLGVTQVVLVVNKMDLVDWSETVFAEISAEFCAHAEQLGVNRVTTIPISALHGDNVVRPSKHADWYGGATLLEHLESVEVPARHHEDVLRMAVQCTIRPRSSEHPDYRAFAGKISSGSVRVGDEVVVSPSGRRSTVAGINVLGRPATDAAAPQSVALQLTDDIDVSRGDVICSSSEQQPTDHITATVCHLDDRPLHPGARVVLKHCGRSMPAIVQSLRHKLDTTTLESQEEVDKLVPNDIATVTISTAERRPFEAYRVSADTGSFLLIDPDDGATLTAGLVQSEP